VDGEVDEVPDAPAARPKPVILLDLDGALNVAPDAGMPDPTSWANWRKVNQRSDGYRYRVQISEYVCSWIANLDPQLVEVRWLTSWLTDPWALRSLETKLDLPHLAFQPTAPLYPATTNSQPGLDWWKWQAVRPVIDAGTPLVWIDDELTKLLDPGVREGLLANPRVLLVEPDETQGITATEIGRVYSFRARALWGQL
jgi:hypothetical protein